MSARRNLPILFCCQCIAASGTINIVTLGGIIGADLAGSVALATLPMSLMTIGMALGTIPAAYLMKQIGRRRGFSSAALLGCGAALLAALALSARSFVGFALAAGMIGLFNASVQQYRFAAAESVSARRVGMAVSIVLLGSIGGAIIGPELATRGKDWLTWGPFTGVLAAQAGLYLLGALLLFMLDEPQPQEVDADAAPPRPLRTIGRQPLFAVAVLGGVVGWGVMTLIMTATPLSMHIIQGHSIEATAAVIRSHVIAMYAPSLISGLLIAWLGGLRMIGVGALTMLIMVVVGLQGHQYLHYWGALVLLGLGWNFMFVGATTLLTRTYTIGERFKAQAVNDFSVFGASATASLLAGTLMHWLGWSPLLLAAVPILAAMLLCLTWAARRTASRAPETV